MSKNIKTIRLACARLLVMWKIDSASERTKYALTTEFAATKNLQSKSRVKNAINKVFNLLKVLLFLCTFCATSKLVMMMTRPLNKILEKLLT